MIHKKTKYPKLYERTYWACFPDRSINAPCFTDEIIHNRNCLAEALGGRGARGRKPREAELIGLLALCGHRHHGPVRGACGTFDHLETYRTSSGKFVQVCSPYAPLSESILQQSGFEEIPRVYHDSAYSYARYVPHSDLLKKRQKRA